jgi:hypothetical protein
VASGGAGAQQGGQWWVESMMQQHTVHDRAGEKEWLPWTRPGLNNTFSELFKNSTHSILQWFKVPLPDLKNFI